MRTTFVTPFTAETAREMQTRKPAPLAFGEPAAKPARGETLLAGFDFGTNTSCLKAVYVGANELVVNEIIPSVVGYVKEGIVENLLPGNAKVLYGQQALKNRLYLRLVSPLAEAVVEDLPAAQDFARHLRGVINAPPGTEVRAVVGLPANADRAARESMCQALAGLFDKVILIPEPFLAALGYREESRLSDPSYLDPVRNSLFVDSGAGTTSACLVQGYFPTSEDQLNIPFAGDKVDQLLAEAIRKSYPDVNLSMVKVRELKEQHSYVGKLENPVTVSLVIGGKVRKLDLGEAIGKACEQLLQRMLQAVKSLIAQASTDSVAELLQNIILTGGGSRIRHIDSELQRLLTEEGYEKPRVQTVGENYKELVAKGALVAGRQAKENQWQSLAG
jgi:rod shape-determining protein MreB